MSFGHETEVRGLLKGLIHGMAILLSIFVVGFVAYSHLISWLSPFDDMPFDAHEWRRLHNYSSNDNPRGPMAESLRKYLLSTRPTKKEVLTLLGDPDCMSMKEMERQNILSYCLGNWSGPDGHTLDIYFDKETRVRKVSIVEH